MAAGLIGGTWQWNRYETRSQALEAQAAAAGKPVVDLEKLIPRDAREPSDTQWRTATVTGVLDPTSVVELRGRFVDNTASLQYLAWLRTPSGRAVMVNLGWQPRSTATSPLLPTGRVAVTGIVRAFEADNGRPGTRITPFQMSEPGGEAIPAYLMATSTCGSSGCFEGLEPVPIPQLSLGPHLSYALQWWLLTVLAAPLSIWITRRNALHEREREATSESPSRPVPRPRSSKQRRLTDEQVEDAL